MPDRNKLEVYRQRNVQAQATCSTCIHFEYGTGGEWGLCQDATFDHEKHGPSQLGVFHLWTCDRFLANRDAYQRRAGAYAEIVPLPE